MIRTAVCVLLSLGFFALAVKEALDARYWRRRLGHWLGYRIAGVLLYGILSALFAGVAGS